MAANENNCQLVIHANMKKVFDIVSKHVDIAGEDQVLSRNGLDSIAAVRLQADIAEAFGCRLPLVDLLGQATVRSLVERLSEKQPHSAQIDPAERNNANEETGCSEPSSPLNELSSPLTSTQAMVEMFDVIEATTRGAQ